MLRFSVILVKEMYVQVFNSLENHGSSFINKLLTSGINACSSQFYPCASKSVGMRLINVAQNQESSYQIGCIEMKRIFSFPSEIPLSI